LRDEVLIKVGSFVLIIIGLFALFIIDYFYTPHKVSISDLDFIDLGRYVHIDGIVENLRINGSMVLFRVRDSSGSINVVIFRHNKENISINDHVEVFGRVSQYKGSLQIISEKIVRK
jgi:RecJ-like exonuclease